MKKVFVLMMMAFAMTSGLFAYEPKKECFEVYSSCSLAYYHEKVRVGDDIPYSDILLDENRCFTRHLFLDLMDLENDAEENYIGLLYSRNRVELLTKRQKRLSFKTKGERKRYIEIDQDIEKEINEAIYEIPFVTKENFYKISKRKYVKVFTRYMKSINK